MREKYNGVLIVNKEQGYTSHDVVARLRGILKQKRIGHTGTLDPDAVGVLPVCVGNATKLCDMLTDKSKAYRAVLLLGVETDTQDMSGTILRESETSLGDVLTYSRIEDAAESFLGEYMQQPPMYSAVKVNGRRLYELAREGREIERRSRPVRIESLVIENVRECNGHIEVEMTVECSKGTYIRTLCHDIGRKLGCGGCMKHLQRVRAGSFTLDRAHTIGEIESFAAKGAILSRIIPTDECLLEYGSGRLKADADKLLLCGNILAEDCFEELKPAENTESIRVYDSRGNFMATYIRDIKKRVYKPEKMFL